MFFSTVYAFVAEWIGRLDSNPEEKEQLETVKRLLRVRKARA
jgi:hypothetical protein